MGELLYDVWQEKVALMVVLLYCTVVLCLIELLLDTKSMQRNHKMFNITYANINAVIIHSPQYWEPGSYAKYLMPGLGLEPISLAHKVEVLTTVVCSGFVVIMSDSYWRGLYGVWILLLQFQS